MEIGDGIEKKKKSIKETLDELYKVTDEEIDRIILEQKIEDEEEKIKILKELMGYMSFEDYVNDHEKEFEKMDISDDFKMIMISESIYPQIDLNLLKKMSVIIDHFGLLTYIIKEEKGIKKEKGKVGGNDIEEKRI